VSDRQPRNQAGHPITSTEMCLSLYRDTFLNPRQLLPEAVISPVGRQLLHNPGDFHQNIPAATVGRRSLKDTLSSFRLSRARHRRSSTNRLEQSGTATFECSPRRNLWTRNFTGTTLTTLPPFPAPSASPVPSRVSPPWKNCFTRIWQGTTVRRPFQFLARNLGQA